MLGISHDLTLSRGTSLPFCSSFPDQESERSGFDILQGPYATLSLVFPDTPPPNTHTFAHSDFSTWNTRVSPYPLQPLPSPQVSFLPENLPPHPPLLQMQGMIPSCPEKRPQEVTDLARLLHWAGNSLRAGPCLLLDPTLMPQSLVLSSATTPGWQLTL